MRLKPRCLKIIELAIEIKVRELMRFLAAYDAPRSRCCWRYLAISFPISRRTCTSR
jgi:hypothetical protein